MALSGKSPFMALKTHGLLLDESEEKMSKSFREQAVDPEDLIYGSLKLDGTRKFGFGTDAIRLWCAHNDGDKDFIVTQAKLQQCNQQVKQFRQLARRVLLMLDELLE